MAVNKLWMRLPGALTMCCIKQMCSQRAELINFTHGYEPQHSQGHDRLASVENYYFSSVTNAVAIEIIGGKI